MTNYNGTLPNGIELYTCLNPHASGFSLILWVREGAMHDAEAQHGLSHFLEHASFRAISERLGGQLYALLQAHGLTFDACTGDSHVRFELSGPAEAFETGLALLLMVLEPPEISLRGLQLERLRVQAEIRENAADTTTDHFLRGRLWSGTPLARTIEGTVSSTNRLGFESLRAKHARWFCRGNFFFSAAGNIPCPDALIARLSALRVRDGGAPTPYAAPVPRGFGARGCAVHIDERSFSQLSFGFDVDVRGRWLELSLLEEYLLGDGGALYMALSEDSGLAYAIDGYAQFFGNIGCLMFSFDAQADAVTEAAGAAARAIHSLETLDDAALGAFIRGHAAWMRRRQDDPLDLADSWGYDRGMCGYAFETPQARIDAIEAIAPAALRALAREIFAPDRAVVCAFGSPRRLRHLDLAQPLRGIIR